jgi:hypothetical protein
MYAFSPINRSSFGNSRSLAESLGFLPSASEMPTQPTLQLKPTLREPLPSIPPLQLQPLKLGPNSNTTTNTSFVKSTSATSLNQLTHNPITNNTNTTNAFSNHRITNLVHPRPSETVSIVRPVVNDNSKTNANGLPSQQKAAIVFPETRNRSPPSPSDAPSELIPETRDHPAGLDMDEFLPKHLQDTMRLGYQPQPEMSESEAMSAIIRGHKSLVTVLSHRRKNIHIILAMWSTKDARNALEQAIHMEDQSVIVDILNIITLKPYVFFD